MCCFASGQETLTVPAKAQGTAALRHRIGIPAVLAQINKKMPWLRKKTRQKDAVPVFPAQPCFLRSLVGKSCSASCASARQNLAAVRGSHSLPEAVYLFSLKLFRLIGSFHLEKPPFQISSPADSESRYGKRYADCPIFIVRNQYLSAKKRRSRSI